MEEAKSLLFEESSDSSFIFTSSSSSSSSDSDDDHDLKTVRVENYLDVIGKYTEFQFKQHFRVTRNVAEKLIARYKLFRERENHGGRKEESDLPIFLTIWYLSNTETYRQISDRFNVTRSSVHRILNRVVNWIVLQSPNFIKWPTPSEMTESQMRFQRIKNFPRVVGAIDGTHIRISPPKSDRQSYWNRKKFYSLLLQGIVDSEKKFIDVHCGEPGSMHDARLFRKSKFFTKISSNPEIIIPGGVLLGDSAYGEKSYLVTPYKDLGNLSQKQKKFNYLHSSTRIVVENAFGLLKSRFRRLHFFENRNLGFVANCIVATCVLHNICIAENDLDIIVDAEDSQQGSHEEHVPNNAERSGVREEIFNHLDNQGFLQ